MFYHVSAIKIDKTTVENTELLVTKYGVINVLNTESFKSLYIYNYRAHDSPAY